TTQRRRPTHVLVWLACHFRHRGAGREHHRDAAAEALALPNDRVLLLAGGALAGPVGSRRLHRRSGQLRRRAPEVGLAGGDYRGGGRSGHQLLRVRPMGATCVAKLALDRADRRPDRAWLLAQIVFSTVAMAAIGALY